MATIPIPVTWVDGTVVHGSDLNGQVRDPLTFFLARPYCNVFIAASQSVVNATPTLVSWGGEIEDNDNMHSTGTNPSRIICQTPGVFALNVGVSWAKVGSSSTAREVNLRLNSGGSSSGGTSLLTVDDTSSSSVPVQDNNTPKVVFLYRFANIGDYIETFVQQVSGSTINMVSFSYFQAMWQIQ